MSEPTSSSVLNYIGLKSLKGRYLFAALFFIAYFLSAAWFAHSMLDETAATASLSTHRHEEVKLLIKEITKDIWATEHTLQGFMLAPSQSQRDIILGTIQSIQKKIPKIMSEKWMEQSSQVKNAARPLEIDISRLKIELSKLMEIRVDVAQRFPATRQFIEIMLPANQAFSTAATLAVDEADELYRSDQNHFQVYKVFQESRLAWNQVIGNFRIYVTNRLGMFINDPLKNTGKQGNDVSLYMNQTIALLKKLDQFNEKDLLGFQEAESLKIMQLESEKWIKTYKETKTAFESKDWRADVPILKKSIQPLFVDIWDKLSELEQFIDQSAFAEIDSLSSTADKLSFNYSILVLVGLALVCVGYFYFEILMRRPIVQVVEQLKERINSDSKAPLSLNYNHLEETKNLVTVFNQMRQQLIGKQKRLETILDNAAEGIITVHEDGLIQGYNRSAEELFGFKSEEVIGQNISMLVPQAVRYNHDGHMAKSKARGALLVSNEKRELTAQRKDGQLIPVSLKLSEAIIVGERYYIGLVSDISEQKAILDNLQNLVKYDEMTGLYNRNYFRVALASVLNISNPNYVSEYALLYIDLDNFKYVNDTLGYNAGDLLLKEVASKLNSETRIEDKVARFGSDVFTVLLGKTNDELALKIAQVLHKKISEINFSFEDKSISINCSIGVSVFCSGIQTTDEVLSQADSACHRAKLNGKNRIYMFDRKSQADRATMSLDLSWSQRIRAAIDNDKFALAYQPIVNTITNEAESYEILIRMIGENNEIIMPNGFLPSAERYGLAADIDKWVISKAMKVLVEMRKSTPHMRFTINLSGQTFSDRSVCDLIRKSIIENGLEPSALTFEVTETIAISDMRAAESILSELRKMGCKTALDDFGSGMSSFAYLKELPVDIVKIDGQFVKNLAANLVDQAMVKAMNEVAQALGKQTVAEFVEDKESFKLLGQFGVNYGQGYHLGKPEVIYPYSFGNKVSHIKSNT